jgi:hypothetical protein
VSEIKPVGWVVGTHSDTPAWSRYRMDLTTLGTPEPVYTADQIRQAVESKLKDLMLVSDAGLACARAWNAALRAVLRAWEENDG